MNGARFRKITSTFPNVTTIELRHFGYFLGPYEGMFDALRDNGMHLRELRVPLKSSPSLLPEISHHCSNMELLELLWEDTTSKKQSLFNRELTEIIKRCPKLKFMYQGTITTFRDENLLQEIKARKSLKALGLDEVRDSDRGLLQSVLDAADPETCTSNFLPEFQPSPDIARLIQRLHKLEALSLAGITRAYVRHNIIASHRELRHLGVPRAFNTIAPELGRVAIEKLLNDLPSNCIESLDMSECSFVDDDVILLILRRFPRLCKLGLANTSVTDRTVSNLCKQTARKGHQKSAPPSSEFCINVVGCRGITVQSAYMVMLQNFGHDKPVATAAGIDSSQKLAFTPPRCVIRLQICLLRDEISLDTPASHFNAVVSGNVNDLATLERTIPKAHNPPSSMSGGDVERDNYDNNDNDENDDDDNNDNNTSGRALSTSHETSEVILPASTADVESLWILTQRFPYI